MSTPVIDDCEGNLKKQREKKKVNLENRQKNDSRYIIIVLSFSFGFNKTFSEANLYQTE